jgi:hypothetical protein
MHMDAQNSSAFNMAVAGSSDAISLWFIVQVSPSQKTLQILIIVERRQSEIGRLVRDFCFLTVLQLSSLAKTGIYIRKKDTWVPLQTLREADVKITCVFQKVGEIVRVPPSSYHQVIVFGDRMLKGNEKWKISNIISGLELPPN